MKIWIPLSRCCAFLTIALAGFASASASDTAQEERWAEQIVEGLEDHNAYWLDAGDREVLALYSPAAGRRRAAVLILHDAGAHPDWRQLVRPLRIQLAARGFDTMTIQMPVPSRGAPASDYTALYDQATERIFAGLETLKEEGNKRFFLIGHGLGAGMAAYFLAAADSPEIAGTVLIGMTATGAPEDFDANAAPFAPGLPVLDIYGAGDSEEVRQAAAARAGIAKSRRRYIQKSIPGAGHDFEGQEKELQSAVNAWLDRYAPPVKRR
jgi:dienelactone hydrolase